MAKILRFITIVGARPQFLKAAALSPHLRKIGEEIIIHTGQHYDWEMSGAFFEELSLQKPDHNLNIGSGTHGEQTGAMLLALEPLLLKYHPNAVIVFGDTNSTLAGALAAAKLPIPVAHIEAGMRSFDRSMPEEVNRVITDHVSSLLFCPSPAAVKNLKREGITKNVILSGDNMLDILFQHLPRARKQSKILKHLGLKPGSFVLLTLHRAGNTDDPARMRAIVTTLERLSEPIVFPLHPRTKGTLIRLKLDRRLQKQSHIHLLDPVPYLDMLQLMSSSRLIMTDSGGVQKEAYALRIPCVTLRDNTEWVETVQEGWNVLVGSNPRKILQAVKRKSKPKRHSQTYGHGNASRRITECIGRHINTLTRLGQRRTLKRS